MIDSLQDLIDDVGLDSVREWFPDNFIPERVSLERRLFLTALVDDDLTLELHNMLARYGFRAVERALLRAIQGTDIPAEPDRIRSVEDGMLAPTSGSYEDWNG